MVQDPFDHAVLPLADVLNVLGDVHVRQYGVLPGVYLAVLIVVDLPDLRSLISVIRNMKLDPCVGQGAPGHVQAGKAGGKLPRGLSNGDRAQLLLA